MRRIQPLAVLSIVGIALVSISAGVVSGLNVRQKAYTVKTLSAHWTSPFDLLVLPKGSASAVGRVIDPNTIDEGSGITLAQWKKIASLPSVAVAAPFVPIGVVNLGLTLMRTSMRGAPSIYQVTTTYQEPGLPQSAKRIVTYEPFSGGSRALFLVETYDFGLVAAVDPAAEQKLVGLRDAVVSGTYLQPGRQSGYQVVTEPNGLHTPTLNDVPVLLSVDSPAFGMQTITVRKVTAEPPTLQEAISLGKHPPPAADIGPVIIHNTIPDVLNWAKFSYLYAVPHVTIDPSVSVDSFTAYQEGLSTGINDIPSLVRYRTVRSPFPKRWPVALEALPVPCRNRYECQYLGPMGEQFRSESKVRSVALGFLVAGQYDPAKLKVTLDPLTHMPLVNYRPEQGLVVLDPAGKALNPPRTVLPGDSPLGLFNPMPVAITSIANVTPILSRAPIASIRVVARGVGQFGLGAQAKLQALADEIHKDTGLTVEIVQGASPEQVLMHPGYEKGYTKVGWIEEQWVRLGAAMEILRQTLLSQDLILVPILLGAFVFALTIGIIGVEVRRQDFATLLALGALPRSVRRSVAREGALNGLLVFLITVAAAVFVGGRAALGVALPVAGAGGIVMAAALLPIARAIGRMEPLAGLRAAPVKLARTIAPATVLGMGVSLLASSARRHVAAFAGLLVPGAVFYLIFLVERATHGTLYLTALGQYILVRVSPLMAMGALVVMALAVLASALIGMRNASLRAGTWAVGLALGWPRRVPLLASLIEAASVGLAAGLSGASIGALVGDPLFTVPFEPGTWGLAVAVITLSALLAAIPATFAISRLDPVAHLRGTGR